MNLEALLCFVLAAFCANLPFLAERILFIRQAANGHKAFGWRLLESQLTPVHEQG